MRLFFLALLLLAGAANAALTPLPGTTPQSALLSQPFAQVLQARLTDDAGRPVAGATVYYAMPNGTFGYGRDAECVIDLGGWCSVVTDAEGVATLPSVSPTIAGTFTFYLSLDLAQRGHEASFVLTGIPGGPPVDLELLTGVSSIVLGTMAPSEVAVRVTRAGVPVEGVEVDYFSGGATIYTSALTHTGADGIARTTVKSLYGLGPGVLTVYVFDRVAGVSVRLSMPYSVTAADGSTAYKLAPLWWGGAGQDGWGMSVAQHGSNVFPVVFFYDLAGQPTWLTFADTRWHGGFGGSLETRPVRTTGSAYYAYDVAKFHESVVEGLAEFDVQGFGGGPMLGFSIASLASIAQKVEPLQIAPTPAGPDHGVGDMWWGGPSQAGWGMSITEQEGNLFLVWFTYDAAGEPTWFVMSEGRWLDANTWTGEIHRTSASAMTPQHLYDVSTFKDTNVGSFAIRFDGGVATFQYSLEGHTGTLALERFPF